MRRQQHEPPAGFRYWAHVAYALAFYAFLIVGTILTALFLLGYLRPGDNLIP